MGSAIFRGLLRRLDYLQGLGVTAIWLMPFQPSPQKDDGYDVADYYGVDPRYGTLGDFVQFTQGCKQRGMRVLIDLVVNHTSDQHPWFQSARADARSPHREWYVWSAKKPANADQGVVFPGVQTSTWTRDVKAGAYYFHRFYDFQPDLDTANPHVQAEILKIMGFWLQLGVSGFRMDAVPFVIATKGADVTDPVEQYDMLRTFREFLQWRQGEAIILGEANVLPDTDMQYFGKSGDRLQMMFNFQVNQTLFYALASADCRPLTRAMKATEARPATAQWGSFLRNHDELDLGRLTDAQRETVFAAFGPDKTMQLYDRGIRRRLAPMLQGDRRRLELAYSLMLTLPGTPVIRYGDEIGMGDNLDLPERNCARTPMQWSSETQGGFTTSETTVLPPISEGPYGFRHVNVATQRRDPQSMLNWTERMLRMRKEVPEIGWGTFAIVRTGTPAVLAVRYDWRNNAALFVHNLSPLPREIKLVPGGGGFARQRVDQPAVGGSQRGGCAGIACHHAGAVRLPLVPGGRARLSAQAQRGVTRGLSACGSDPGEGGDDARARADSAAQRAGDLRDAAEAAAIRHRHLDDAQPGAGGLHLHFDVPAIGHLAHVECRQRIAADGAVGAHVAVARAVQRAHAEARDLSGEHLMPVHRARIAHAAGARGQHEIMRAGEHGAGDALDQIAPVGTVAVEEDDDIAFGRGGRGAGGTCAPVSPARSGAARGHPPLSPHRACRRGCRCRRR